MEIFGNLYVVATPIGNFSDITLRAIDTLKAVKYICCEDTRRSKKLLEHFGILGKQFISYHAHSGREIEEEILLILISGNDVCYLTDAGTPGISDPISKLINFISLKAPELKITPIPGVSALSAIVSVAGIYGNEFVFGGFLPKKGIHNFLGKFNSSGFPAVFFDSPHRFHKNIDSLIAVFGEGSQIVVGRELTKIHESIFRGTLAEAKQVFTNPSKGEIVFVVGGRQRDFFMEKLAQ